MDVPLGVEKLKLRRGFTHPLTLLPTGLKELEFSYDGHFNHPLVLPSTLKKVSLSMLFNHPIVLTENLEAVTFSVDFNQPITLPPALKTLEMRGSDFNHPLQHLPESLEELYLSWRFNYPIVLPDSLHSASFGTYFRKSVTFGTGLRSLMWWCDHPLHLPPGLKELTFGKFQHHVDLPEGLEKLRFGGKRYSRPLTLPSTLKSVAFDEGYALPLELPARCVRQDYAHIHRIVVG